jgi:hypothetical protein
MDRCYLGDNEQLEWGIALDSGVGFVVGDAGIVVKNHRCRHDVITADVRHNERVVRRLFFRCHSRSCCGRAGTDSPDD